MSAHAPPLRRPTFVLTLCVLSLTHGAATVLAEDEAPGADEVRTWVRTMEVDADARADVMRRLAALGWARIAPHLALPPDAPDALILGRLRVAHALADDADFFAACLAAIHAGSAARVDDPEAARTHLAEAGIRALRSALGRGWSDDTYDSERPRLTLRPDWWPGLLRELYDMPARDPAASRARQGWAAGALGSALTEQVHGAEDALRNAAHNADWRVRMLAISLLGSTRRERGPVYAAAIEGVMDDPHERVRQAAVRVAMTGAWAPLYPAVLRRALDRSNPPSLRATAIAFYTAFHSEDDIGIEALVRTLGREPNPTVRCAALRAAKNVPATRALIVVLLEGLVSDDAATRAAAAAGFRFDAGKRLVPDDLPVDPVRLRGLLEDGSPTVRHVAMRILAERGELPTAFAGTLVPALTGEDAEAAYASAVGLGLLREHAAPHLDAMRAAAGNTPFDPDTIRRITPVLLASIDQIECARMSPADLARALEGEDPARPEQAVRELAYRGDNTRLAQALGHEDWRVVLAAGEALASEPAFAPQIVPALLRAFPQAPTRRVVRLLWLLREAISPYAARIRSAYEQERDPRWFRLMLAIPVLQPALVASVWPAFEARPTGQMSSEVGRLGALVMPRLVRAFASDRPNMRLGAADALRLMEPGVVAAHRAALEAVMQGMPPGDHVRMQLEGILKQGARDLGPYRPPLGYR